MFFDLDDVVNMTWVPIYIRVYYSKYLYPLGKGVEFDKMFFFASVTVSCSDENMKCVKIYKRGNDSFVKKKPQWIIK